MSFGLRWRVKEPATASVRLSADVLACAGALGRKLPRLAKKYSLQAFTVALAMHLRATLMHGLRDGHFSREQAQQLVDSLLRTDAEVPSHIAPPRDASPP
jgi:hypothetical protein